jgi:hypothetical protein
VATPFGSYGTSCSSAVVAVAVGLVVAPTLALVATAVAMVVVFGLSWLTRTALVTTELPRSAPLARVLLEDAARTGPVGSARPEAPQLTRQPASTPAQQATANQRDQGRFRKGRT